MKTIFYTGMVLALHVSVAIAEPRRIPDEFEIIGGSGLARSNTGVASDPDLGSILANPALMSLKRQYRVGGSYNWPSSGRDFYLAQVIDTVTSEFAAGLSYTGFSKEFDRQFKAEELDSPIFRRTSLSFSRLVGRFSLGFTGTYLEGYEPVVLIMGLGASHRLWGEKIPQGLADEGLQQVAFDGQVDTE